MFLLPKAIPQLVTKDDKMHQHLSHDGNIRLWKHGEFPMPDWVSQHMLGQIEANGTFITETELGRVRVHLGNIIVERRGTVWVKNSEEVAEFIEGIKIRTDPTITNIGPGKSRLFGVPSKLSRTKNKFAPPIGAQPTIEWIHLTSLSVDNAYQRSTENGPSRRLITSIAAKFDWRLCAPLVVSRRADDTLTIIDGQHRWMAACLRNDIPQLPCCVFRYQNMEEEARMFIVANRARKPISRLDDYFAAISAADEDALEIQQLVKDAGLTVARATSSSSWRPGEIAFTSAIANAVRRFGPAITSAVLTNMAVAFPGQKLTHGGAIFGGLIKIMSKPAPDFDPDRLLNALQTYTVDEWGAQIAGANGGDKRIAGIQDAIMAVYNQIVPESYEEPPLTLA
jgi:hypothetical protein